MSMSMSICPETKMFLIFISILFIIPHRSFRRECLSSSSRATIPRIFSSENYNPIVDPKALSLGIGSISYAIQQVPQHFQPLSNYINSTFPKSFVLQQSTAEDSIKKDLQSLKARVDKLEKSVAINQIATPRVKTPVTSFMDSLTASTITMNPRTVELCAILSFFIIGTIIGASVLDRLWLLGGIGMSYWASGAVHRDTRGGMLARRIGAQLAMLIMEAQEKYNQFVIFYRTGQLAYVTSKVWDQYDNQLSITKRLNQWKRIAMERAATFNSSFDSRNQLGDMWKVMLSATDNARQLDQRYNLTSSLTAVGKSLYSGVLGGWSDFNENTRNNNYGNRQQSRYVNDNTLIDQPGDYYSEDSYEKGRNGAFSSNNNRNRNRATSSLFSSLLNGISGMWNGNRKKDRTNRKRSKSNRNQLPFLRIFNSLPFSLSNYKRRKELRYHQLRRGRLVNPWTPVWEYLNLQKSRSENYENDFNMRWI